MLGSSTAAVITFDGQHVPYYVTYQSGDYRCKPYRKSVQYCRTCGAIGHRQDICPQPRAKFCYTCGRDGVTEEHDCHPKCKICGGDHETAGKECKKKLRNNPPPYQVRRQQLDNARARENHWSSSTEDFPALVTTSDSSQGPSPQQRPGRRRSRSILRSRSTSRSRSRSRSVRRITYVAAANGSSASNSSRNTSSSDETATIRTLEHKVQDLQRTIQQQPVAECNTPELEDRVAKRVEESILKQVETRITKRVDERLQAYEAKILDLVERRLQVFEETLTTKLLASADRTIQTVITKIMEKVEPLTRTVTTLDAKLDGFMAQQHNFMTYAYKNFVTHEHLAEQLGTKRKGRKTVRVESAEDSSSTPPNHLLQVEDNHQHGGSQT